MIRFIRFRRSMESFALAQPQPGTIVNAFLPPVALVPFRQDSANEAIPVVTEGSRVREGQLIARSTKPDMTRIHAPIPGLLRSIRKITADDGSTVSAAEIVLSGSFDILGRKEENFSWKTTGESEILKLIEDKGVVCTFDDAEPLAPILRSAKKQKNPAIVVRLFDLDPTCQLDSFLAANLFNEVIEGAALIARAINTKELYFIHNDPVGPDPEELGKMTGSIEPVLLKTDNRYPSGNRKQLTKLLGSAIHTNTHVFIDPSTAVCAYDAVVHNKPVLYRYVHISGPAIASSAVMKAKIGTTIGSLIHECGGFTENPSRIVMNGLITGTAVSDLATPITKTTKSIHVLNRDTCPDYQVYDCVHCGRCLQVCPVYLDPMELVDAITYGEISPVQRTLIESCQHCGCCTMVCPSRIPLHHILKDSQEQEEKGALT